MEILNLPSQQFSVPTLQNHFKDGLVSENFDKCIDYVLQYYYESENGNYYKYNVSKDEYDYKEKKDFNNEVLCKLNHHKTIDKKFKMNDRIFNIISKIDKPRLYKENGQYYLNMSKGLMHKTYKSMMNTSPK